MSSNAVLISGDGGGAIKVPILEQYAAIRTRQKEIANAERPPGPALPAPTARQHGCAIWVRYANGVWFLSSILPPDGALLNPYPAAAMRFGTSETAAALIAHVPALRDKAYRDEAGIIEIGPGASA